MKKLGRLAKVPLRDVWRSESDDFTPWLIEEANLSLLGETLNLDLELESSEQWVGQFRADIVARDASSGEWVLIENQLEATDHDHLGKLLTYAAGLKACIIVWIARRFTDEHRAAIDWLNDATGDHINFFGIELEVWQIANSPPAPKFNIVAKPNDWTNRIHESTRGLSATRNLQLDYWTAFNASIEERGVPLAPRSPQPKYWHVVQTISPGVYLTASINSKKGYVGVELYLAGDEAKSRFSHIEQRRIEIEKELGVTLDWMELPERAACRILLKREANVGDRTDWENQFEWIRYQLLLFHTTFTPLVQSLTDKANTQVA